jgi:tetratricopeptide (TPR) repeat protein
VLKRLFGAKAAAPDSAEACFRLGSELAQSGQLDQAIALLRRAVELAPHGAAYHNLASAYRDRGDAPAALAAYREAARLDPRLAEAHYGVGLMLMGERRYEEALASLRRAIELNPRFAEARFQAGNAHMGLGDWQAALAELKAAIDARPDYAEARWARAMSQLPAVYGFGTDAMPLPRSSTRCASGSPAPAGPTPTWRWACISRSISPTRKRRTGSSSRSTAPCVPA